MTSDGYPKAFIRRAEKPRRKTTEKQQIKATASIPYVQGITEAISRILAPIGIRTVSRKTSLKWSVMRGAKDQIPGEKEPGVVYVLGCKECPKVYVGETSRTATQRMKEHQSHVRNGHPELSAVASHVCNGGHPMHWKPMIVAKERVTIRRRIKEALTISRLNKGKGTMNLDAGLELSRLWLDLV